MLQCTPCKENQSVSTDGFHTKSTIATIQWFLPNISDLHNVYSEEWNTKCLLRALQHLAVQTRLQGLHLFTIHDLGVGHSRWTLLYHGNAFTHREKCTKHLGPLGWLKLVCFPQTTKNALCSSSWFFIDCDVFEEKYEQEITKRRKKWSWYCYSFCHKFNQHKRQHHITSSEIIKNWDLQSPGYWVTSLKSQGHFQQVSDKVTAKYLYLYYPVFLYLAAQHT